MITYIIEWLGGIIIAIIKQTGYFGVIFTMAVESACIPLPSEIIMPFAGFLVSQGHFSLWGVAFWGAVGNLLGSWVAYLVGKYGGRPFLDKYGKYVLLSHHDLNLADSWFKKYGEAIVFFSRLLPVVRTFISLPAGIASMNPWKFSIYTFAGALPWSLFLAYLGYKLGAQWMDLRVYFHRFDLVIGLFIIAAVVWFVRRHIKHCRHC